MNTVPIASDQRVLREAAARVDVGHLEVVTGMGADRLTFLHRLVTGPVAGLAVGAGCRALLLDVKGHITADLIVAARSEDVRLVTWPDQGAGATAALARYAVMDDVTFASAPADVLGLFGPRAAEALARAGLEMPPSVATGARYAHAEVSFVEGVCWILREVRCGAEGFLIFGAGPTIAALHARLDVSVLPWLSREAAEAARIDAGEPAFGSEINADYFPMELGLDAAIDYRKGCYLGQEPIVRIRDRGHINWRLVRLRLRGPDAPAPGDLLEHASKARAGKITSAAPAHASAPSVALAMLHTSVPVGEVVRIHRGEVVLEADVVG
jgi:folate-binding protein YgfZ